MRILHTSDWHLGRSLHRADLGPGFALWCDHVVDLVERYEVDALLIAGDVYDRGVPPQESVALFGRTLARLADLTTVVVTSGNHDSPTRLGFGAAVMRDTVHIRTDALECGNPVIVTGRDGRTAHIYPIPYVDPDVERTRIAEKLGRSEPLERSHEAVVAGALELVGADIAARRATSTSEDPYRLVMAHAFVVGGEPSPSERPITVGGVDSVPSGLFSLGASDGGPIDYVALGHLHSPQRVGTVPLMRYAGSPLPFSFDETREKSSVLLTLDAEGVRAETIPAPVWRTVRTFTGTLDELLALAPTVPAETFSRIIVTDDSRPSDMGAALQVFPHVLEIQHRPTRREVSTRIDIARTEPLDVLAEFFAVAGNREITAEERAILADVWETVAKEVE